MSMTRADRINTILAKVAPKAHAEQKKSGKWPFKPGVAADVAGHTEKVKGGTIKLAKGETPESHLAEFEAKHRQAPYLVEDNGTRARITVTSDDGDVYSGVGKDVEEALSALEKKLS